MSGFQTARAFLDEYPQYEPQRADIPKLVILLDTFALAQLRRQLADLERRRWLRHIKDCPKWWHLRPDYNEVRCTCGLDEMKRELGQK